MTAPIGGTLGSAIAQVGNSGGNLGKREFLELLVAQLRHQDPLSPMNADELAVQLAQFSSVEQLIQINDQLSSQAGDSAMLNLAMNTSTASATIGKKVLAAGNQVVVNGEGDAAITVDVAAPGGRVEIAFYNSAGVKVAELDGDMVQGGRHELLVDAGVPEGLYSYQVSVTDSAGNQQYVQHYTSGVVNGVQFAEGGVVLRSGDLMIPMSDLIEIEAAASDE